MPYINHPIRVAHLLAHEGGITDPEILAAALLHDTIEDTATTAEELRDRFGPRVAALVEEMSDDKSLAQAERKQLQVVHAPHLSRDARCIKLADKIANVDDIAFRPPATWPIERRREYLRWAEEVVQACGPTNAGLEACFARALREGRAHLDAESSHADQSQPTGHRS